MDSELLMGQMLMKTSNPISPLPLIETPRLLLRRVKIEDAADIFVYASDAEVSRYVGWEKHQTLDDSVQVIQDIMHLYDRGEPGRWGIIHKDNQQLIGMIGFSNWFREYHRAEVDYVLGKTYWGYGLMTEALQSVIRFGFSKMLLHRVEGKCFTENFGSARVMEKCNMIYEGTLRDYVFIKGIYKSMNIYATLRN
jgi:[ribosomal protein S5]-alanine N-acetyltransferase